MIATLTGIVRYKTPGAVILDVAGVGYELAISSRTYDSLPAIEEEAFLHVYTNVREDSITLFGFEYIEEKQLFLLLVGVSGIGPKLGLAILSGLNGKELRDAIMLKDYSRLTALPGVGKKTAQRLCMELGEKIGGLQVEDSGSVQATPVSGTNESAVMHDAVSALVNLGYHQNIAWQALRRVYNQNCQEGDAVSVEELIRLSLQGLAQQ
ncbi:Holliday junction branch migration protein RuvA [Desulfogranum japonicum]|uniref:Holliday junction branch migration protein RuvA n=1 Tax=Desulfogranum japonicum TaxID=231447 RepID=UPI00040DDC11|nr:Holliday junction branch migration protein RuvA [Desulfogranum japonicum]